MPLVAAPLAVVIALLLTACGGGTKVVTDHVASNPTTSGATGTGTTTTATTTSTPSTTSSTTTTTTTAANPECSAATLRLGYLGGQGATGHGELGFSLTNVSRTTCHTYGYPGVLFLSGSGSPLPTHSTRTTTDFFGHVPAVGLTVAPGAQVSFRLAVTHVDSSGGNSSCTTAGELQAIPPNDTHTLVVKIPGGAYECGTASVSPLQPGTTAFR